MMATSGVWSVDNTWFGGFGHKFYETGAICFKQKDPFVVSPSNTFNNVAFGFEDPTDGNRVLNAVDPDDLASATVGNKVAIFYDKEGKVTSKPDSYVLQPTDFQLSDKSEVNENWHMEVSQENFAQIRVLKSKPTVTMMRNDLTFQTSSAKAAFNVITGGKYHYVMKFSEYLKQFVIGGIGITRNNAVVLGVCVPRNSSLWIQIKLSEEVSKVAPSAKDIFTSDNYQYYFDSEVGLQHQGYTTPRLKSTFRKFFGRQHDTVGLYEKSASVVLFKVTNSNNFAEGDVDECPKGLCTIITVSPGSSNKTDMDCFERYKHKYLNKNISRKRRDDGEKKSSKPLPSMDLNKDWGAKEYELRT